MDIHLLGDLYDIAMSPGGGLFLYAAFMSYLWYDTRKKLWAMVQELEKKVATMQKQYDKVLRDKVHYQTLYVYTQELRNDKKLKEVLDGTVPPAPRDH